jgi:23S rRNA (pseudouridine1915-N3)-methyltransferase
LASRPVHPAARVNQLMRVRVLCVGGVKGPLQAAIREYEGRVPHYWKFTVEEVAAGAGKGRKVAEERVREAEEERLLARLKKGEGEVVALTREGKSWGSRAFSAFLQEQGLRSVQEVTFVIGGAFGLGKGILAKAKRTFSLSPMTLPHELARLLLAEQLYRAGTILKNEPYHKGP